jgi:hypothetical protein
MTTLGIADFVDEKGDFLGKLERDVTTFSVR